MELDGATAREVEVAARIAGTLDASLLVVHVVPAIAAPAWIDADVRVGHRARIAAADEELRRLCERSRTRVPIESRIVSGRVADTIAALAAAEHADLAITMLRDREGWFGARRGAVSYHVLTHATTPVLACPPRWPR